MKFIKYFTVFAFITANIAQAETISDKELQQRFNKAFSVFNQEAKNQPTNMNNNKKSKEIKDVDIVAQPVKKEQPIDNSNIVKQSNSTDFTAQSIPAKTEQLTLPSIKKAERKSAGNFILLEDREVLVDMQNANLKQIIQEALNQVDQGEKWVIRWRLKDENKYLLEERINITAEVTFDSFVGNMLATITNTTGIRLSTKVFNKNKIIIITDSF